MTAATINTGFAPLAKSLRAIHDAGKKLIQQNQLSLEFESSKTDRFMMPVALLVADPKECRRRAFDAELVESIAQAYASGQHVDAIEVRIVDGLLRIVHGFTRFEGLKLANARGANIQRISVVEVSATDSKSVLVRQLVANTIVPLSAVELADAYLELQKEGHTVEEIASMVGKSGAHVYQTLQLALAPVEIKQAVESGEVTKTDAIKAAALVKQGAAPEQAVAKVTQMRASSAYKMKAVRPVLDRLAEAASVTLAATSAEAETVTLTLEISRADAEKLAAARASETAQPAAAEQEQQAA